MKYTFVCKNGHTKEINCKMGEVKNQKIFCEDCGLEMHQQWTTAYFRAMEKNIRAVAEALEKGGLSK